MKFHTLKSEPEPFAAVLNGKKTCEVRRDDRFFEVGDSLVFCEWIPALPPSSPLEVPGRFTGRQCLRRITHISLLENVPEFHAVIGCKFVVLSIEPNTEPMPFTMFDEAGTVDWSRHYQSIAEMHANWKRAKDEDRRFVGNEHFIAGGYLLDACVRAEPEATSGSVDVKLRLIRNGNPQGLPVSKPVDVFLRERK